MSTRSVPASSASLVRERDIQSIIVLTSTGRSVDELRALHIAADLDAPTVAEQRMCSRDPRSPPTSIRWRLNTLSCSITSDGGSQVDWYPGASGGCCRAPGVVLSLRTVPARDRI